MADEELDARVKTLSVWGILKELPFEGGPSTTRFVFLATFAVCSLGFLSVTAAMTYVYITDKTHPAGAGILAVLTLMLGTLTGVSANSQNVMHQLSAQLQSKTPIDASSTPASAETSAKSDG